MKAQSEKPLLAIITVGNEYMGDDGAGPAVFKALSAFSLPDHVELIDGGTGGMTILHIIRKYESVILVDCADFGGIPGDIILFSPENVLSMKSLTYSLHDMDLMKIIDISRTLGEAPSTILIVAIQPNHITFNSALSPEVAAAIPRAVQHILSIIHEFRP
ncbi:MAG: hydrogenase maturation protease [Theionarchaea archaeon]|nr:hydrogenase maturation protease [Theionarchaea archaeon]